MRTIPVERIDPVERIPDQTTPSGLSGEGKVRIEDVARLAGVSIITVSRALRKPAIVSEATRARVAEAVRATGFNLNPHASALRSGRSRIVAIFVSSTASEQFLLAVDACSHVIEAHGFEVVLVRTSYSHQRESRVTECLMELRPAGVFITGVLELELSRATLRRLEIPVVESWAYTDTPIDMLVGISNTDGATAVTRHLIDKGYRRIAYIGRSKGRGLIRLRAFEAELARANLKSAGQVLVSTVGSHDDGRAALARLLESGATPDAIFCSNDLLACGALLEARTRGLDVPGDLAIAGFGDNSMMRELSPGITTITGDVRELGRLAGEMLAARLDGGQPEQAQIVLPLYLISRGSC